MKANYPKDANELAAKIQAKIYEYNEENRKNGITYVNGEEVKVQEQGEQHEPTDGK